MDNDDARDGIVFEQVSCLECGQAYAKRIHGGTAVTNPGCPRCGYVGWIRIPTRSRDEIGADRRGRPAESGRKFS
jgi:predicted  nucleic acid-binding Zn-ribbon protein